MIDKNLYREAIKHKVGQFGDEEMSTVEAYRLDGSDGILRASMFEDGTVSSADYFLDVGNKFYIIELSDLESSIRTAHTCINEQLTALGVNDIHRLRQRDRKQVKKKAWDPLTNEFKRKWLGSIAAIERMLRINRIYSEHPEYQYIIVCKNHTDIRVLDELLTQIKGMIRKVKATNTDLIEQTIC
ncbi:MAG: hypothetical protein KJ556_08950 [Gammaproteobacteria bacterium]|nr:hypothetical protein [Gammaproteobacteria bacterium]MBU2059380.1 hypothetical protein [Gammaproteobacteria bacterium]MBU2175240.1 hypothetical protein [Gammaproteobacteria bacterium]MBU2247448.1 hypothetical protein [Gammaproteobacteria bacterium]MBU2346285.1 hypothetical protein [Gammaproteobacteria bacterium]